MRRLRPAGRQFGIIWTNGYDHPMSDDATDRPDDAPTAEAAEPAPEPAPEPATEPMSEPATGGATPPPSKGVGRPVLIAAFLTLIALYVGMLQLVGRWFGPPG